MRQTKKTEAAPALLELWKVATKGSESTSVVTSFQTFGEDLWLGSFEVNYHKAFS
jgi:hypothetical protein